MGMKEFLSPHWITHWGSVMEWLDYVSKTSCCAIQMWKERPINASKTSLMEVPGQAEYAARHSAGNVIGRFWWKAMLCLVCIVTLCPQSLMADKATDDFNLGLGFYRAKRWDQAAETLGQFVTEFPGHPRNNVARLYHARALSVLEKYEAARKEFATFIRTEPDAKDIADARYRLGECSYFLKDYPSSISQLNDFLGQHPDHNLVDWARLLLGDAYVAVKEFAKAAEVLGPISTPKSNPAILADARFSLGKAYEGLNRPAEALTEYQAVAADRNATPAPRALNRVASTQYAAAQYKEAAASFEFLTSAFSKSPLVPSSILGAGMSWYRAGEYEKALEWLRRVPADSPGRAQAVLITALSLKELGRVEESRGVFAEALKAAGGSPLAADVLFQQAQLERASGNKELAAGIFEDVSDRWPQFNRVADCLFNASELRLELNQSEQAERLWTRLKTDFPELAARPREQILLGRLFLTRNDVDKSITVLGSAVAASLEPNDRITAVGRYYLCRAFYEAKQYQKLVEQVQVMDALFQNEAFSEIRGALALAAMSSLQLQDYESVLKFADEFLPTALDVRQKADVMAARSVALTYLKRYEEASRELNVLIEMDPDQAQTWTAVLQAAETALEQKSPDDAAVFFTMAAKYEKDPAVKEAGVTGIAWSQFKASRYAEAEKSFAKVVEDYPSSEDMAENLFMQARAVEEQGDPARTATAYTTVFTSLTKDQAPAAAGDEALPPLLYAFDAGRQAARSLQKLKRIDEADGLWEKVARQFPEAKELDRLLEEWAWMNATAERFDRSDAIHKQMMEQFPDSPFAGQARLSLAESLLEAGKLDDARKEMEAIVADTRYGTAEKERALFHIIEIQAASRNWAPLVTSAQQFLADYLTSPLGPQVRLFSGNAHVELQKPEQATEILTTLRNEVLAGEIPVQDWTDRIWVVLGEAALASRDYEQIDALETELKQRSEQSPFAFQMMDVQGRRWKQQAPPNFEKAREYFRSVTSDNAGKGTETAARCQFLLAETLVLEMKLEEAVKEYFKVYLNYRYDELRAQALFQAASCEAKLQKTEAAVRDYKELIATFPASPLVSKSTVELRKLGASGE